MAEQVVALPKYYNKFIDDFASSIKFCEFNLIVSMVTLPGDNFMGEIYRIVIDGKLNDGTVSSKSFILKVSPFEEKIRQKIRLDIIYGRESMMYSTLLPRLDQHQGCVPEDLRFHYPKMVKSVDDPGREAILMEDLADKGFVIYNRLLPMDYDHLKICFVNMARFHAAGFALKVKDPGLYRKAVSFSVKASNFSDPDGFLGLFMPDLYKIVENEVYEQKVKGILDIFEHEIRRFFDPTPSLPYDVLCHGDCWSSNFLFKYENGKVAAVNLVDWQLMRNSSPCYDIGTLMFTATDKEMRTKYYDHMLDLYYETLAASTSMMGLDINECYPESVYRNHLKYYMRRGIIHAMMTLPLTLSNRGEGCEVKDMLQEQDGIRTLKFSENCITRLKDIFEFATERNLF